MLGTAAVISAEDRSFNPSTLACVARAETSACDAVRLAALVFTSSVALSNVLRDEIVASRLFSLASVVSSGFVGIEPTFVVSVSIFVSFAFTSATMAVCAAVTFAGVANPVAVAKLPWFVCSSLVSASIASPCAFR